LFNSSPYYAQANGQAESINKTLIKVIKKKIEDNQEVLSEALEGLIAYQGMVVPKLLLLS
jgi:hypothetical protein